MLTGPQDNTLTLPSPVAALKALKNATEISGFRASHVRDGAALAKYFAWLEDALGRGEEVSECEGADVLEKYRSSVFIHRVLDQMADESAVRVSTSVGYLSRLSPVLARTAVRVLFLLA
jgi:hypothetical protein